MSNMPLIERLYFFLPKEVCGHSNVSLVQCLTVEEQYLVLYCSSSWVTCNPVPHLTSFNPLRSPFSGTIVWLANFQVIAHSSILLEDLLFFLILQNKNLNKNDMHTICKMGVDGCLLFYLKKTIWTTKHMLIKCLENLNWISTTCKFLELAISQSILQLLN